MAILSAPNGTASTDITTIDMSSSSSDSSSSDSNESSSESSRSSDDESSDVEDSTNRNGSVNTVNKGQQHKQAHVLAKGSELRGGKSFVCDVRRRL